MPDLQTALSTALNNASLSKEINQWDAEEKQRMPELETTKTPARGPKITNNVVRECFDAVHKTPGLTGSGYADMLSARGFKTSSVYAVMSQLIRTGQLVRDDDRKLFPISQDYTPMTSMIKKQQAASKKDEGNTHQPVATKAAKKVAKKVAAKLADLAAQPAHREEKIIVAPWSAESVIDKLSVMQGRQLYDLLKNIYGGY